MTTQNLGSVPVFDAETFEQLAIKLFDDNGRLRKDDPDWNCPAKVCKALAESYQARYPKAKRVPGATWLKDFVKSFLGRHPDLNLSQPRQRKP